jgi:hypothetical protein
MASRGGRPGRLPKVRPHLFTGLLRDAEGGGTMRLMNKGKKGGTAGPLLVPYRAVSGAVTVSFPLRSFEEAVLSLLKEIDPREVLPEQGAGKADVLAGRYFDALADVLERQEAEQKALAAELTRARQEGATPLAEAWQNCRSLLDVLAAVPDEAEARIRLRAALRRVVDGVWCLFVARGSMRLAAVQIMFTGGGRRDYLILHRRAVGGRAAALADTPGGWPARWWARSLASVAGGLDLRRPEDAAELEQVLLAIGLQELMGLTGEK